MIGLPTQVMIKQSKARILMMDLGPSINYIRIFSRILDPPTPPVAHSMHLNDPPPPSCVRPVKNLRPPPFFPVLLWMKGKYFS